MQTIGISLISSPAVKAFLEQESKGVTIEINRFGTSSVVRAGYLFGTLLKECRSNFVHRIEELILEKYNLRIPLILAREKIFASDEEDSGTSKNIFAWTNTIKCKTNDLFPLVECLDKIFGPPSQISDPLRPLVRFIPSDIVLSCDTTRAKYIEEKHILDDNILALNIKISDLWSQRSIFRLTERITNFIPPPFEKYFPRS
jgi:hypothetical protein